MLLLIDFRLSRGEKMFAGALLDMLAREPIIKWSSGWTYIMFGVLLLMIICGTWAGAVAARKGRSMQWWFIIGFFLPIIGLVIIYILKPISGQATPK
jgi:DMSO reductase anchor subunit